MIYQNNCFVFYLYWNIFTLCHYNESQHRLSNNLSTIKELYQNLPILIALLPRLDNMNIVNNVNDVLFFVSDYYSIHETSFESHCYRYNNITYTHYTTPRLVRVKSCSIVKRTREVKRRVTRTHWSRFLMITFCIYTTYLYC